MEGLGIKGMCKKTIACAKEKALVKSGLLRVMLAGLIQHAQADIADELESLYREVYRTGLDASLAGTLDTLELRFLLAMARTSFSLILGCESPRGSETRERLASLSFVFDLILCPLVLFHDLPAEARWEQGQLPVCDDDLCHVLINMAKRATEELPGYLDQDVMLGHVRADQLRIVKGLYLPLLPDDRTEFKRRYEEQLDVFIDIFAKGRHDALQH